MTRTCRIARIAVTVLLIAGSVGEGRAPADESGQMSKKGTKARKDKKHGGLPAGVRCAGTTCQVDGCWLEALLGDRAQLTGLGEVHPVSRDPGASGGDAPGGLKVSAIRPGSLLDLIGVRNGDVIKSVEGEDVSTPTRALLVYASLAGASDVSVQIERAGKPLTYHVHVNRPDTPCPPPAPASSPRPTP